MSDTPIRYCHGCEQYDNQPRVLHIGDVANPADDKLYHYDCVPADVLDAQGLNDSINSKGA